MSLEDLPLAKRIHLPIDEDDIPLAKRLKVHSRKAGGEEDDIPLALRLKGVVPKAWVPRKRVSPKKVNLFATPDQEKEELVVVDNPRTQDLDVIGVISSQAVKGPRTLEQVHAIARPLMAKYLPGWTFGFDNASKRGGLCDYQKRHITMARLFALSHRVPDSEILNVILHEIAHGLTPGAKHGPVWKKMAMDLGCTGDRCHKFSFATARFKIDCPCGKVNSYRSRVKETGGYRCKFCKQQVTITNTGVKKPGLRD